MSSRRSAMHAVYGFLPNAVRDVKTAPDTQLAPARRAAGWMCSSLYSL